MAVKLEQKTTGDVTTKKLCRLFSVAISHTAAANVIVKEGGSGGTTRLQIYCPASGVGQWFANSKEGVLIVGGLHVTVSAGAAYVEYEILSAD